MMLISYHNLSEPNCPELQNRNTKAYLKLAVTAD